MSSPRVSVVVRTKDRPALLSEAVESLRQQTLEDFEVVVVNDGGTPPLPAVLGRAPGLGLRVVTTAPPHGRARALNEGIRAAAGRYVAYLDDDDLFHPTHLETLARFLDGSDQYGAAYTDVEMVEQKLGDDGRYHESARYPAFGRDFDPVRLLYSNYVPLICLMHHRSLAGSVGSFDETFDLYEDWDFLIRLAEATRFHRIPRVTASYRVRDDGTNATRQSPWLSPASQASRQRLYEKHWERRSPATDTSFLDAVDHELRGLRSSEQKIEGERRERARVETEARLRLAVLEDELRSVRADAARQVLQCGDRERTLAGQLADVSARLDAVNRSLVWRLFTPYWKLKSLLRR